MSGPNTGVKAASVSLGEIPMPVGSVLGGVGSPMELFSLQKEQFYTEVAGQSSVLWGS